MVSLFAGIGGFDLGMQQAGMTVLAHVEKDANCRKLLKARWPDAEALDDVCTAGAANLPRCDVLCGGWPCQDLSQAGKRAGLAGARSGLFYEYARIAYELQPAFLVWENVPGLLTSDDGRDMLRVVRELQRIGYCGGWRTLDAQYLGVAQRRRRVFGVFARADIGAVCAAEILSLDEGVRGHPAPRREAGKEVAGTLGGSSQSSGFRTTDLDNSGAFVCGTVSSKWAKGTGGPAGDECYNLVAFSSKDSGADAGALAPTLRSMNFKDSHINGGGQVAVAFQTRIARNGRGQPEEICPALNGSDAGATSDMRPLIAYTIHGTDKTANVATATEIAGSIRTKAPGSQENSSTTVALTSSAVRRLTPRECERLQGFPDDWTAGFSDSVRYRMLGNAVAVPVARWIGSRIVENVAGAGWLALRGQHGRAKQKQSRAKGANVGLSD